VLRLCTRIGGAADEPTRVAVAPYLDLLRRVLAVHPAHGVLAGAASALARRIGAREESVVLARRAVAAAPSMLTEMWLGYAYRTAGRVDEAVAAWRRALRHDPRNLALYTDIAEILAGSGRLGEALDWIARALRLEPKDPYAFPTSCVLRFMHNGNIDHLVALSDHIRAHPGQVHAYNMLTRACHGRRWLGAAGGGDDAVSDLLRQVRATDGLTAGGSARLSALEVPSAVLTLERTIPGLALTVADIPAPDLREPRRAGAMRLWTYEATTARPAVEPPSAAAGVAVATLASKGWPNPAAAYDLAVRLAGLSLDDLVSLLAHPPTQPVDSSTPADPGVWVRAVQAWACLGILHHRADEPWLTSVRRKVLIDVAFGIEDWAAESALFALVTAAWVAPEVRADVAGLVRDRFADALEVGRHRAVSIVWSLARLALITPELSTRTRRAARAVADGMDVPRRGGRTLAALRWRLRRRWA
jgi:tetratricopeptide (TPR) repeat protein